QVLRGRAWVCGVLAALLLVALGALTPARAASKPLPPSQDPFYTSVPPTKTAGAVLNHRTVQLALFGSSTPIPAEQLLYQTTDQLGRPTVTVTTVLQPAATPVVKGIVGYMSFYDGLGS